MSVLEVVEDENQYTQTGVAQGRINQAKAKEEPNTFGTESGADNVTQMSKLDKPKQRMAGQMGHRVLEYMNDPAEQERTNSWMEMFGLSNEGMQFNQAKINGVTPSRLNMAKAALLRKAGDALGLGGRLKAAITGDPTKKVI